MPENEEAFLKLVNIMAQLRGVPGCPWDKEQTIDRLKSYLLEETWEVVEAIEANSAERLKEELGDLLFQILFLARICEEEGKFDIFSVVNTIADKMVRRHPHVFGQAKAETSEQVLENWARIKEEEARAENKSFFSGIPQALPSLVRARRVTERASWIGFDWHNREGVWTKVKEEFNELERALASGDQAKMQEEMGDLLFTLVNLGRFLHVDAEEALRQTVAKFISRFHYVEQRLREQGKSLAQATMKEMDELWEQSKD